MNRPGGQPRKFTRYVAIGDSFTEGMSDSDPDHVNRYVGWADRLSPHLARLAPEGGHLFGRAALGGPRRGGPAGVPGASAPVPATGAPGYIGGRL